MKDIEQIMADFECYKPVVDVDEKEVDIHVNRIMRYSAIVCRKSSRSNHELYDTALRDLIRSAQDLRWLIHGEVKKDQDKDVMLPLYKGDKE